MEIIGNCWSFEEDKRSKDRRPTLRETRDKTLDANIAEDEEEENSLKGENRNIRVLERVQRTRGNKREREGKEKKKENLGVLGVLLIDKTSLGELVLRPSFRR